MFTKTFHYRLYPTKEQRRLLDRQLEECRWLWNTLLAERKQAWEERRETVDYYMQKAKLPELKAGERPMLQEVHSQVLQDVALRLKRAFDAFFRRLNAGEEPGYPRFRGQGRYTSLTFPQVPSDCALDAEAKRLTVSKVGSIKVALHRSVEGKPKTATLRRTSTGKWFLTFNCEWEPKPLPQTGREVVIDVGLKVFAMPTEGNAIENPRFFRVEERALVKAQRKCQQSRDGHNVLRAALTALIGAQQPELEERRVWQILSQNDRERVAWRERQHRRRVVARIHERIRWRRSNFTHQESRRLVNYYDLLAVEDLSVRNMMANRTLAKGIADAAWTQFHYLVASKAAWAGRQYVAVNPAYTSQDCSGCGHRNTNLTLSDRIYNCPHCSLILDRDRNAAINILTRRKQRIKALG